MEITVPRRVARAKNGRVEQAEEQGTGENCCLVNCPGREGREKERESFTSRSNAAPAGKNDSVFQLLLTSSRDWR